MQALRKSASVLMFPAIVWLGAACERAGAPTEPPSATGVAPAFDLSGSASSPVIWVNDDDPNGAPYAPPGTSCNNPGYATVQSAVDIAGPGDRINVCTGTYVEQVTFVAGKNNIQLRSVQPWQAVIKAPAVMVAGLGGSFTIVRIMSAQNVTIADFTITGPGPGGCGTLHYGVRVEGAGAANILGNHITDIRDEPLSGCQNGVAIGVGRAADVTTGSAKIIGNLIDNYQKNGPTVSNVGSSAEIANNRVLGIGPTTLIAQNGIQVSGGATASVRNNSVAQNIYSPQTVSSTGILLFSSGNVVAEDNTVTSNDVGIYVYLTIIASTIEDNRVRASTFDGVIVQGSSGQQVAHNRIDHNAGPGIGLYDAALNNTLNDNQVENNDDSGILLDVASNNVVSKNKVNDNGTNGADVTDGIRINLPSTGNTIRDNRLKNNVTHDCHDGSTGNTWIHNRAQTSFPSGLCSSRDHDERGGGDNEEGDSERSPAFGWNGFDTQTLLQLLPSQRAGAVRGRTLSPVE